MQFGLNWIGHRSSWTQSSGRCFINRKPFSVCHHLPFMFNFYRGRHVTRLEEVGMEKLRAGGVYGNRKIWVTGRWGRTCMLFLWDLRSRCSSFSSPQPEGHFLPRPALCSVVAISHMWLFKWKYQWMEMKYRLKHLNLSVATAIFQMLFSHMWRP